MKDFVHLHVHTEYSHLDGISRIVKASSFGTQPGDLIEKCSEDGMHALAITDHGNLFGIVEFYLTCREKNIKPIIGCEFYLSEGSASDIKSPKAKEVSHITILAKNEIGYKNLIKLNSYSWIKGFYYRPRIDMDALEKFSDGLIVLSGCIKGKVASLILKDRFEEAITFAKKLKEIFAEDFYIEVMDNDLPEQKKAIPQLCELARRLDLKVVATNDVHYSYKEDAFLQDVALAIGTRTKLDDPNRLKLSTQEFYLKSPEEMERVFAEIPQAIKNTKEIAEKCNVSMEFENLYLPAFNPPDGKDAFQYLKELCNKGLKEKYPRVTKEVKERLEKELSVIKKMGFSSYFLIVWDFINYAKTNGIYVGPGRGSGAGSIVAYLLNITGVDPIKYGLLFERFLNPGRITLPDLDIDFEDIYRDRVIDYVKHKYGENAVSQIITFNTLGARGAVRDVGRVMGRSVSECDRIAKMIPMHMSIDDALTQIPELKKEAEKNPKIKELLDIAKKLEGLKRHYGVHAAGVVITPGEITDFIPIAKARKGGVISQFEGDYLIKLGLLKMDFLGLKTLTVIRHTVEMIKESRGISIDIEKIPLDDKKTFDLLGRGETFGVFQVESSGMQDILRKMKPTVFTDLAAVLALYRPGPLNAGMVEEFIERKHGKKKIEYLHPALEDILEETYGIILYQEQVMMIAQKLAGFSLIQADILRKAMGKKILSEMEAQREAFIKGCVKNGVDENLAEKIFELLAHFGAYGFNKSHSTAYAFISYQTAYLKANYPTEFMTALLNSVIGDEDKTYKYILEAQRMLIKVHPPDINESFTYFKMKSEKEILFGLLAIKNTGEKGLEDLVKEREKNGKFKNFDDFVIRMQKFQSFNKRMLEFLIKAGVFSRFEKNPDVLLQDLDRKISNAEQYFKQIKSGQQSLFDSGISDTRPLKRIAYSESEKLKHEKEALGFYFTGHPLTRGEKYYRYLRTATIENLKELKNSNHVIVGLIKEIKHTKLRKGGEMTVLRVEDLTGMIEVICFKDRLNEDHPELKTDSIVVLKGTVSKSQFGLHLTAEKIYSPEEAFKRLTKKLSIEFMTAGLKEDFVKEVANVLKKHPGNTSVSLILVTNKGEKWEWGTEINVEVTPKLLDKISEMTGENSWTLEV